MLILRLFMVFLVQAEAVVSLVCRYWTILGSIRQVSGCFRRLNRFSVLVMQAVRWRPREGHDLPAVAVCCNYLVDTLALNLIDAYDRL